MTQEEEKLIELLKSKLPQLLRDDEEFRIIFLGTLVQYLPTREEIKLILERMDRVEAELLELRKEQIALRQDFKAIQKNIEAILERMERIENQQAVLIEHVDGLERETRAGFERVDGRIDKLERVVHTGFSRFGIIVEDVLRNALQTAVENWLGAGRVEPITFGGREIDVVIHDSQHIILEITSRAHLQDIDRLKALADDYERQFNIRPRLAIACAYATPTVVRRLVEENIEIISAEVPG